MSCCVQVPRQDSETCEYEAETETSYYQCNTVVRAKYRVVGQILGKEALIPIVPNWACERWQQYGQ